jgi:hypothetical protein
MESTGGLNLQWLTWHNFLVNQKLLLFQMRQQLVSTPSDHLSKRLMFGRYCMSNVFERAFFTVVQFEEYQGRFIPWLSVVVSLGHKIVSISPLERSKRTSIFQYLQNIG